MWLRLSWVLCVLAHFAVLAASKSFSAAYEKIWLYYAYQVAWKLDGPSQTYVLRQLDKSNSDDSKHWSAINNGNRGSLPNGQMTWEEFQLALSNLGGQPAVPALKDDIDKLAAEIWQSKIKNKMMVDNTAAIWNHKNPVKYHSYIDSLSSMVLEARSKLGDDALKTELAQMTKIAEAIVKIRSSETRQAKYLGADLKAVFPGIKLVTNSVSNPGKPSEIWEVVDTQKTLKDPASETAIRKAVGMESDTTDAWKQKFFDRVNYYGATTFGDKSDPDNPFANEKAFTKAAKDHRNVLAAWSKCFAASAHVAC